MLEGEIKLDENNFSSICKRGHSAGNKTAMFGLLKQNDKAYIFFVKDTKINTPIPIITSKILGDLPTTTQA